MYIDISAKLCVLRRYLLFPDGFNDLIVSAAGYKFIGKAPLCVLSIWVAKAKR